MNTKIVWSTVVAVSIALVTACGGGGGGSTAGIGGTGITASGPITGFGSVFVNGIEFETDTSAYLIDDVSDDDDPSIGQDDLNVGMVVTITGTVNDDGVTGTADNIEFDHELEGPVSAVVDNGATKTLTVMGIDVEVSNSATGFGDNITFAAIDNTYVGVAVVEVSGHVDASGTLIATYIGKRDDPYQNGDEVEAKGVVSNLDTNAGTFDLVMAAGSIPVNYTAGTELGGLPGGALVDGLFVEAKGTLQAGGVTPIDATEIEAEGFEDGEDNVSLEGVITDFVDSADFVVAGQRVDASAADLSPDSLTLGDGIEVKVEGAVVGGVLVAEHVERED